MNSHVHGDTDAVTFTSEGQPVVGILYRPPQTQPTPATVLLHGIPGSEKNHDLAQVLRAAGWQVLVIHFRGAWGSGGTYHIRSHPVDAQAALDFLLRPGNPFPVDAARLAIVGFSLGSRAALLTTLRDQRVKAAISVAGIADFGALSLGQDFCNHSALFLNGVDGDDIMAQWNALAEEDNPLDVVSGIKQPLLIIHSPDDEVIPFSHGELLRERLAGNEKARFAPVEGANHIFAEHRQPLIELVAGWLLDTLP